MKKQDFWNRTWSQPYGLYNRHHRDIWSAIKPTLKGKIADLGCGPAMIYQGTNVDVTGVDFSESAIREAQKNYPQGSFFVAEATDTKLPNSEFDAVVMFGLLDYFEDWTEVLTEARRILKPGGIMLATLLNGYKGRDWTRYKHVTGDWYLFEEQK